MNRRGGGAPAGGRGAARGEARERWRREASGAAQVARGLLAALPGGGSRLTAPAAGLGSGGQACWRWRQWGGGGPRAAARRRPPSAAPRASATA